MTTVSIVIPAYNHARYLAQAIDSVLAQTYRNVELIVLDDGSTDDTRLVLERHGGRFRWESHPNMGQSATLNKGWEMSRGDIIGYLSADDILYPACVSRTIERFGIDPALVLSYCDFEMIDQLSRKLGVVRRSEWNLADLALDGECPPGPGAFFRREAYEKAGRWDPNFRRVPDYEFWLRLGVQGTAAHIPEALAAYRMHEGAQSFSPVDEARADESILAIESFITRPDIPNNLRKAGPRARANALLHAARLHLLSGRAAAGFARVVKALMTDPASVLCVRGLRRIAGGVLGWPGGRLRSWGRRAR